jgi:hypothetical protein
MARQTQQGMAQTPFPAAEPQMICDNFPISVFFLLRADRVIPK